MVMICPYCDTEINEKQMEAEDGCCPECGSVLTQSNVINGDGDENEDDIYGEYDDDDDDYSAFGERCRDYDEEYDEFDEFLEEEEKLAAAAAKNRNKQPSN